MIFFITFLRALAAILITNSHYTGVYPTDLIANGGLLGDIIFFAISGYCLYSAKGNFFKWYGKRLWRVYLPVVVITLVYVLLGFYVFTEGNSFIWWFVYPTSYHFVASIVLLYIPFYVIMKIPALKERIPLIMLIVAAVWLLVYIIFYDKSYYHIDNVREPMIRFLFFESMLLGAYFKQNDEKYRNKFSWIWVGLFAVSFVTYFASKLVFSKYASIASIQPLNQIIIFFLLYTIFRMISGIDEKLEGMPNWLKVIFKYLSQITLEIYLVQSVIIALLRNVGPFPINWILITASILLGATALHYFCKLIYFWVGKGVDKIVSLVKNKQENQI